jgi:hypothetical protein
MDGLAVNVGKINIADFRGINRNDYGGDMGAKSKNPNPHDDKSAEP